MLLTECSLPENSRGQLWFPVLAYQKRDKDRGHGWFSWWKKSSRSPSCDWQAQKNETSLFNGETCRLAFDFFLGGGRLSSSFFLTGSESEVDPSISLTGYSGIAFYKSTEFQCLYVKKYDWFTYLPDNVGKFFRIFPLR